MKINNILLKPVLTEKATNLAAKKVYMFEVNKRANKFQIENAIKKLFSVKKAKVSIVNRKGKTRKVGRRMTEKTLTGKKIAYVKLNEGKIDLFPQA